MRKILIAVLALAVIGCAESPEPLADPPTGDEQVKSQTTSPSGDSVGIVSPAAGTSAPVTNPQSVTGAGGGGVGAAAKSRAKKTASEGGSSLDQLNDY